MRNKEAAKTRPGGCQELHDKLYLNGFRVVFGAFARTLISSKSSWLAQLRRHSYRTLFRSTPVDHNDKMPPKRAVNRPAQENVSLGPQVREGELVFGVARIFASFNDTFVHVTDLS